MLVVQRVAQYFGIAVHNNALVLCAVAALVVNFSSILLSAYLTFNHLMMLVIMVIVSAALVTGLNEYFLRRQYLRALFAKSKAPKTKPKPVPVAEDAAEPDLSEEPILIDAETEPVLETEEPLPESEEKPEQEIIWEVELPPGAELPEQQEPAAEQPGPDLPKEAQPEFAAESPVPEPKIEMQDETPKPEPVPEAPEPEPVLEVQEKEPEPEPVPEEPEAEPEPEPVPEIPEPEPEPEPVPEEPEAEPEIEETEPSFAGVPDNIVTLDEHLDYAYAEKEAGRIANAAAAYQQALENFADDSYAPFLVIELGNLYKEAGAYEVAAGTYRDALSLPIIQGQTGIVEEFRKNIDYLDAVSHITARHDAPEIPFSQIPPDWIAEIEAEFAKQTGN